MLQNIRKSIKGPAAKVIVAIIVVPFALFGIESLLSGGGVQFVAEVNGQGISAAELQQQVNQQKRRLLMSMGENFDPEMLDDQMLAGPSLDFMIRKELLLQASKSYRLAISDQRMGEFVGAMSVFQTAGRFDPELYRRAVADQGYSPAGYQKALREDLMLNQLRAGLAGSEFATPAELERMAGIAEQQRDFRYMVLPLGDFRDEVALSEDEILEWYVQHQDQFTSPESVVLAYIEVDIEDLMLPVEEGRLLELYELEKDSLQLPEERRVSHIQFQRESGESEEALLVRMDAARKVLATGEKDFATLAGELSQDVGSAGFGGDLGFTAGDTFPPEIEEAVANLDLDAISTPINSGSAWHLLKVTEIRAGESRDFASVRAELELRLQNEEASLLLVKKVEGLRDLVFNADDLAGPATQLELSVQRSEPVVRNQELGLFSNPRLNNAAFSQEVLTDRFNSEVIELDSQHYVVLRVLEHTLPAALPLDEVRDEVVAALADARAQQLIVTRAEAFLQSLAAGASIEQLALENGFEWQVELAAKRDNRAVPPAMLKRVFQIASPAAGQRSYDYVQNSDGDIELFELVRVTESDAARVSGAQRGMLANRLSEGYGQRVDGYYQQALRDQADVVRN